MAAVAVAVDRISGGIVVAKPSIAAQAFSRQCGGAGDRGVEGGKGFDASRIRASKPRRIIFFSSRLRRIREFACASLPSAASSPPASPIRPTPVIHQGPALRTLMQFVEIEPSLCVTAASLSRPVGARGGGDAVGKGREGGVPGEGTVWGGLFAEVVRTIVLGPCSMQPKLLEALGGDYVNVHDDVRYVFWFEFPCFRCLV